MSNLATVDNFLPNRGLNKAAIRDSGHFGAKKVAAF